MASTFQLEIVTPDRKFFEDEVDMVIAKTTEGYAGILSDHVPMVSPLSVGVIKIKKDGKLLKATCAGGFISTDEDKAIIVTDAAEWPEEIDIKRAEAAMKRAQERLKHDSKEIDVLRAQIALNKALNRLRVSKGE
ncbi:F0F1 ATP synthase subunit epsilon [Paramaledivibacter caminithermalis]|jgi:F-type H+-transporting ATPase subunit epsilon|uniref:ATP synthase epsilon chain n=1 Tax=Paramaledivibacter caminithermalis (strain DSM 15212 / CIP 107654 / DViRD3) TaxID=1121301 RepID=A0A1M6L3M9_PARC5|nr:F0F1 ATP synthase subunit epsilon [Paramaledivibacter caminithermalis]SHJ65773.1 ATP synthase F1 subcomplex epsilon subunit [Paramaledivibacter caminithermalis DSM 15212]